METDLTFCILQLRMEQSLNGQVEEASPGTKSKDDLLNTLTEAVQELEAVRVRNHPNGAAASRRRRMGEERQRRGDGTLGPAADDQEDEEGGRSSGKEQAERSCKKGALRALRELSVHHSETAAAWREVCVYHGSPPGGGDPQPCCSAGRGSRR